MNDKPQLSIRARLIIVALGVLAGMLVVEVGVRLRQQMKYGTTHNTVFEWTVDAASGLTIPEPGQATGRIRIDSRGFRSPELVVPKPPDRIRLAFLGASTTFCAEVSSNEATWPSLVWKALQDKWPDRTFDYVNAGVPGYGVAESLRNLKNRVAPLQPDVIFYYEASNDLSADTRALAVTEGLFSGKAEESSWPARWSLAWYLVEKNLQLLGRQQAAQNGTRRLEFDPRKLSIHFHEELLELVRTAREVAPVVVLLTFSHKVRWEQSPEQRLQSSNTSLYYMPYMSTEGLLQGFEEYNRVIREVAHETGALLVEVEAAIPGTDRYFHDSVHFTDAGAETMSQIVVQALLHSDRFDAFVRVARPTAATADAQGAGSRS